MTEPTAAVGEPWRTWRARLPPIVGVVGLVVAALSHADVLAVLPPRIVPYAIAFSGAVLAMTRPLAGRRAPRSGVQGRGSPSDDASQGAARVGAPPPPDAVQAKRAAGLPTRDPKRSRTHRRDG